MTSAARNKRSAKSNTLSGQKHSTDEEEKGAASMG